MVVHFAGAHISQFQRWFFGVSLAVTRDIRVEPHPDVAFTVAEAMDRATGGASSCRSTTRRVTRMQRRLPWGPSPLGEKSLGLFTASVCLSDAAPLRVPPPLSESAVASWLCFAPHPPLGFCGGLQSFSHSVSRDAFRRPLLSCRFSWLGLSSSELEGRLRPCLGGTP